MSLPPRDNLRFGQQDRRELEVLPQYGQAGTRFDFKAYGFKRGKSVRVVIQGPKHYAICDRMLTIDEDGSIDSAGLYEIASADWPSGTYIFSVDDVKTTFTLSR